MLSLKKPPPPTWYGTPANLVDQFVAYVRHTAPEQHRRRLATLNDEIYDLASRTDSYTRAVRRLREQIDECNKRIVELTQTLFDRSNLSDFEDGLLELMDHPLLLGLRIDDQGRLVAHFRVHRDDAYIGDYEIGIYSQDRSVDVRQTDVETHHTPSAFKLSYCEATSSPHGSLSFHQPPIANHFRDGAFVQFADTVLDYIRRFAKTKALLGQPNAPNEPTWQGVNIDLEQALWRSLDFSINNMIRREITELQRKSESRRREARDYADIIRSNNLRVGQARAELARLSSIDVVATFNDAEARRQLREITTFPGVMGVRFIEYDGVNVPVFHVRTTIVYDGCRYDIGDYEIRFIPHDGATAVINVAETRRAKGAPYYFPQNGGYTGWFCYGARASELRRLFEAGQYAEFMNVAINSMNAVNRGSERSIPNYFTEISMNAVWKPVGAPRRLRRRRRGPSELFA